MQTGFNTNIRHRGVLFHVQSEDSGRNHPHIITHLYHGGTILASEKSSYAEHVDDPGLELLVKERMEGQHKAVLKRLVAGAFDGVIRERLGEGIFAEAAPTPASEPAASAAPPQPAAEPRPAAAPAPVRAPAPAPESRSFGEGIVSEKPLDEVILSYLVENARKRKRPSE